MTWPSIDHGLLSPSGRMSKRARKQAEQREWDKLFGKDSGFEGWTRKPPTNSEKATTLRRSAAWLRHLASLGVHVRSYPKAATKLEAEADKLGANKEG